MEEKINSFVRHNKSWILQKSIALYIRAFNNFTNLVEENGEQDIPFEKIKYLTELLYTIKEDLYIIFKRIEDTKTGEFEKSDKCTPTQKETEFMHNVGLLFHKLMVAREFKYVMEHYSGDSEDYAEITQSFNYYLNKVEQLWKDGLDILAVLLKDYRTNVLVLSYLLENNRYVKKSIGFGINDILNPTGDTSELDKAYNRVAQYFIESGWKDRARRILGEALKLNPGNKAAAEHLVKLNSNDIENN